MPSDKYTQAMKEAYASAKTDIFILNTLQIGNSALETGGGWPPNAPPPDTIPPTDTIDCALAANSGGQGAESYWINLGTDTGTVTFSFNAYNIPDRFSLYYGGQTFTTGFRGSTSYDDDLAELGYPPTEGSGSGSIQFTKGEDQYVLVVVEGPLGGTAWNFTMGCPNGAGAPEGGDGGGPPGLPTGFGGFYIVQATEEYELTLEDDSVKTFEPVGFNFKLPGQNDQGIQELSIEIDNVDRRIGDFVRAAALSDTPTIIKYRPYLSTDLTTPQLDPPLEMVLSDLKITETKIIARASFADIINLEFLTRLYTRREFPSLGNT